MRKFRMAGWLGAGLLTATLTTGWAAAQDQPKAESQPEPLTEEKLRNDQLEWRSDALDINFKYPADLVRRDPKDALDDEHLMVYGVPGGQTREIAQGTSCLRPMLSLELPTSGGSIIRTQTTNPDGSITVHMKPALLGTALFSELEIGCLSPAQQAMLGNLQTSTVALLAKVPGMHSVLPPAEYTMIDTKQKLNIHMAGAQGQPLNPDTEEPAEALLSYTLAFTTMWNNHLLVWFFSSNSAGMMNRMTKSTVKFGSNNPATLYPPTVRMAKPSAIPPSQ
ncbi:MAG TPA: hypothetical protein VGC07_07905 [Granulicella sp.]